MNKSLFIVVIVILLSPVITFAEIPKETIQKLFNEKQFKRLDSIAEEIRKNRKILDDGSSEIGGFYQALTEDYRKEKEIVRLINICEEWKEAYPNSPTPLIALSMLYRSYAWVARGTGWARTVTGEQWDVFHARMNKAYEYVNNEIAEKDIRSYVEKIINIRSIGGADAKKKAYAVLDKGISIEPDYHSLYIAMAGLLLEKWYGDDKYEMISFINKYTGKRNGIEGEILYIKTLLAMSNSFEPINYLNNMGVSWSELKGKIRHVLISQPDNIYILNAYWYFSGMALDFDKAEEIGNKLDSMHGWISNPWWDSKAETGNAIKVLLSNRDRIAVFTLSVGGIWNGQSNLVAYYDFLDANGKKIDGADGAKETLTFSDVHSNYAPDKIVRYVIIPSKLLNEKVTIRYTIENPNTGNKVEGVKTFDFIRPLSGRREASALWDKNLLKNPSAETGAEDWVLYGKGGTISADAFGRRGNIFYTTDFLDVKSQFRQEITVPRDLLDAYVVVAGYLTADKVVEGSISRRPYLHGYFIFENNKIVSYLQNEALNHSCQGRCWQARAGIFKIPPKTEIIRIFLDHGSVRGDSPDGSSSYYDDLELRPFKTLSEAEKFVEAYKEQHPQILWNK